jgi:hypothetical protein
VAAPYLAAVPVSYPGIQPSRDAVVVDIEREELVQRKEAHFDPDVSDEEMAGISPAAIRTASGFDALTVFAACPLPAEGPGGGLLSACSVAFAVRWGSAG